MADKKINQLDDAAALSTNNYFPVNQDPATGKALKATLGALRSWILGGANAGARIYFNIGAPSVAQGIDGDVAFDIQAHAIYQKVAGAWVFQDSYGAIGGTGRLRFTATYGSGGLAVDGKSYTSSELDGALPTQVLVEADPLIAVEEFGTTPAFDEFDYDLDTSTVIFGAAVPAGARITIIYGF